MRLAESIACFRQLDDVTVTGHRHLTAARQREEKGMRARHFPLVGRVEPLQCGGLCRRRRPRAGRGTQKQGPQLDSATQRYGLANRRK